MKKLRQPLLFTCKALPIVLIATFFMLRYQLSLLGPETINQLLTQVGSVTALMAIGILQTAVLVSVTNFVGYLLSNQLGLWKPFRFEADLLRKSILISLLCGFVFSLDYWTFGAVIPGVREAVMAGMTSDGILASVFYGGIIEELLMRLFFLSLVAWILWKLFARKRDRVPAWILVAANVAAALLFAALHLPATTAAFGALTPMLLIRCFLINGGFGMVFGWLYLHCGLHYAMLGHAVCHIVSKIIWLTVM